MIPTNMVLVHTFNYIAEPNVQLNKSSLCLSLSSSPYIHNIKSQKIPGYVMACVGVVKEHECFQLYLRLVGKLGICPQGRT